MPVQTVAGQGNDAIIAHNFEIDFGDGLVAHFLKCSGFSNENEVTEHREARTGRRQLHKTPGPMNFGNITLSKGMVEGKDFWDWISAIADGQIDENRRNGTISLYDLTNTKVAEWELIAAWPVRVKGPSFNASSGEIAIEELELVLEGFIRKV